MEIRSAGVQIVEGGRIVTIGVFVPGSVRNLEQEDFIKLDELVRPHVEASSSNTVPAEQSGGRRRGRGAEAAAPAGEPAPATEGRRRRGAEPAEAGKSTTATDQAPVEGTSRRRRSAAPSDATGTADAGGGAPSTTTSPSDGRRRRAAPAAEPEKPKTYTEADVVKAATAAHTALHAKLKDAGTKLIVDLIDSFDDKEGYACEKVDQIKPEDRAVFIDKLNDLVKANA